MPAAPIARLITSHPDVVEAVVYGVPDPVAGDQVMAAVVPGAGFDPAALLAWLEQQPEAGKLWAPTFLRIGELPRTATGKVIVRELVQRRWSGEGVWVRDGHALRPMTADDVECHEARFAAAGRRLD
jgi:fatty-acyl-CoA synthase